MSPKNIALKTKNICIISSNTNKTNIQPQKAYGRFSIQICIKKTIIARQLVSVASKQNIHKNIRDHSQR